MNSVKQKAPPKKPKLTVVTFEEMNSQFLIDTKGVVTMEDIPQDMVVNWDQTAIKYPTVQLDYGSRRFKASSGGWD